MILGLYDKNKLDLTIQAQREHFKLKLKDNLQKLKQSLNSIDLIPVNIRLLDLKEIEEVQKNNKSNIYTSNVDDNIDLGLNIRV